MAQEVKVTEIIKEVQKRLIAKEVLFDLPEWFGIPEYTNDYIEKSTKIPFLAIYVNDKVIGFGSLKETSKFAIEIFCMGILKQYHRNGFGKSLYYKLEKKAKELGYKYIHVKTVKTGKYLEYDKTNAFYKSVGFCELEVLPTLWDEWNPCQIYIKTIN